MNTVTISLKQKYNSKAVVWKHIKKPGSANLYREN